MGNDGQLPLQPEQQPGRGEQESYWQYEQDEITEKYPVRRQPQPQQRPYPPGAQASRQPPPFAGRYEQPVPDMEASLGYGQGTEYSYASQPSQALPVLPQFMGQQVRVQKPEPPAARPHYLAGTIRNGRDGR